LKLRLVGGPRGKNHGFRGYLEVKSTFLTASTHQSYPTCRKGVLQHPTKFQDKILTGKFYLLKKSKYPLGG